MLRRLDAGLNRFVAFSARGFGPGPVTGEAARNGFGPGRLNGDAGRDGLGVMVQAAGDETFRRRLTPAEDLPDDQSDHP